MSAFDIRTITHSVIAETVDRRSACPVKRASPKKSPVPRSATTASFPCSETTIFLTLPWTVEETDACHIVRDANGQALGYFYFDEEQQSPAIDRRLTRDDARRMAVNFAKLPDLVASRWLAWRSGHSPYRGGLPAG